MLEIYWADGWVLMLVENLGKRMERTKENEMVRQKVEEMAERLADMMAFATEYGKEL